MPVIVHLMAFTCKWMSNGWIWSRRLKFFWFFFLSQAFAWFSDLLVEHAEIFWSLFAVDMDSTLEMQPPDTWDSFPLFQLLNDYLRNDGLSVLINFCWVVNSGKMYRKPWMDMGCQDDNYQYWKWQGLKWQLLKMYIGCFD